MMKKEFCTFMNIYMKNHNGFFLKKLLEIDLKVWLRLNLFLRVTWVIHSRVTAVFISPKKLICESHATGRICQTPK